MSEDTYSHEGAKCPACGYVTGDCFEWLNDESRPQEFECYGCKAKLRSSVQYWTTYTTALLTPSPEPNDAD